MKNDLLWGLVVMLCLFVLYQSEQAYAQQSVNLTKVIEDKYTREIKSPYLTTGVNDSFVKVIYEGPNTVILKGDLITPIEPLLNTELWQAMDLIRNQYGFKIQQVIPSGVGSEGNPTVVYILMIK